ncbi:MAG: hypothetical protein QGH20_07560, partial [Candidatus Latescibacteria bacterium]|nr:hypothetical protein [Candidatus Latescibacterota bacterium]
MTNDIAIPKPPLLLLWATAVWTCAPSTVAAEETRHQLSWPLTNSSHEFAIGIGGSLDAENSGDYRHNNQFEVSRFIRIANRGDNHIVNPRIRANGHTDWWDVEQGLRDIIDPSMSDKEKALAIYWFVVSQRYHNPGDDGDLKDPIKFLGVYGYGFCTNTAILLAALWGSAGLESRFWRAHGHDVSEVWYDGGWHLLDGDIEVLYKLPDGHTIAGYEDLVADPFLVVRAPPYGQAYRDPWPGSDLAAQRHSGYFGGRAIPDQRYVTRRYATGHTLALTLIPDAVFTWSWVPLARFYTMPKWIGRPPRRYGSGRWEYAPDFRSGRWLYGADMAERVEAGRSGSLPMIRGTSASQPGRLKYSVRLPYVCVDGLMVGQVRVGDGGVVSITAKMDGSDRRELTWRWQKKGVMPFVLSLKDLVAPDARGASYGMSFEIVIEGGELTGLDSLRLVVDSQLASAALPRMRLGPNTLRVTHESAAPIDALLTYNWRERANVGLPYQAAEPVFPLEGAVVDSLSWTFEWTPALNPDGDPVVGYIFELSEYPDMRWPFGPEWVSEIKKGVTNDITSFTPPPHALVAPNRTYYWRVRARTTGRLWGRWSDVWSVSARGPGAPKRVRIEMVGDKPYLTWEP